ncbi:unnamed protein product [Litomosoides sigmodontis]|uniref:Uncharacterized protein n=1 Tax=Litomosoides sigmodontis TaxID=42156 RepID=A0A3P6UIW3_LITSI|nr:unnamed protein product [Litomosoides sigmodontis]
MKEDNRQVEFLLQRCSCEGSESQNSRGRAADVESYWKSVKWNTEVLGLSCLSGIIEQAGFTLWNVTLKSFLRERRPGVAVSEWSRSLARKEVGFARAGSSPTCCTGNKGEGSWAPELLWCGFLCWLLSIRSWEEEEECVSALLRVFCLRITGGQVIHPGSSEAIVGAPGVCLNRTRWAVFSRQLLPPAFISLSLLKQSISSLSIEVWMSRAVCSGVRVVKEFDSKSNGLCPRRFESCPLRDFLLFCG